MDKKFEIDFMQEIFNDDYCSVYEVLLLHIGENRNKCDISKKAVELSLPSFYNKPLYALLNNNYNKANSDDFANHYVDSDDIRYKNYDVEDISIFGMIPESAPMDWIQKDNKEYLRTQAIVWKNYCGVVNDILQKRDGNVKVSIEICLEDFEEKPNGITVINKFKLLCVTMLGEKVMEGIAGSSIKSLKFSHEELNDRFVNFSQDFSKSKFVNSIMSKYNLIEKEDLQLKNSKKPVGSELESLYNKIDIDDNKGGEKKMGNEKEIKNEAAEEVKNEVEVVNEVTTETKEVENEAKVETEKETEKEVKNETTEEVKNEVEVEVKNEVEIVNEVEKEEEVECKNEANEDVETLKEKYNALEKQNAEMQNALNAFKRADEEKEMSAMVDKFSHCMSAEKKIELQNAISTAKKEDMEKMVNAEVTNFALSFAKVEKEVEKEDKVEFSINPMYLNEGINFSHSEKGTIANIVEDKTVKVNGK
jgi:hypothetical protein